MTQREPWPKILAVCLYDKRAYSFICHAMCPDVARSWVELGQEHFIPQKILGNVSTEQWIWRMRIGRPALRNTSRRGARFYTRAHGWVCVAQEGRHYILGCARGDEVSLDFFTKCANSHGKESVGTVKLLHLNTDRWRRRARDRIATSFLECETRLVFRADHRACMARSSKTVEVTCCSFLSYLHERFQSSNLIKIW